MKKFLVLMMLMALSCFGLGAVTMVAAEAHNATGSAACDTGFVLDVDSYDASQANTYSWTVGDKTDSGTFADALHVNIPVPQDGATTNWSYEVQAFDGTYHFANSGTVGPCGTTPPPPHVYAHAWVRLVAYCNAIRVEGKHHIASISWIQPSVGKHPHKWTYRFLSDAGSRFDNGTRRLRVVIHTKHGAQCHGGSDS